MLAHQHIQENPNNMLDEVTTDVFHHHWLCFDLETDRDKISCNKIKTDSNNYIPTWGKKNSSYKTAVASNSDIYLLELTTKLQHIVHNNNAHGHPNTAPTGIFLAKNY